MAPKNDLAALAAKEALAEKAAGKSKSLALVSEERDFCCLRRGPSTPKIVQPVTAEKVGDGVPDLIAIISPPFSLDRSARERSSRSTKVVRERIKGAVLPEDVNCFEQAPPEGLIR